MDTVNEIVQEVEQLSLGDVWAKLLQIKTKQRVSSLKYTRTHPPKVAKAKKTASIKAMVEFAQSQPATVTGFANLYEQILSEANQKAKALLAEAA